MIALTEFGEADHHCSGGASDSSVGLEVSPHSLSFLPLHWQHTPLWQSFIFHIVTSLPPSRNSSVPKIKMNFSTQVDIIFIRSEKDFKGSDSMNIDIFRYFYYGRELTWLVFKQWLETITMVGAFLQYKIFFLSHCLKQISRLSKLESRQTERIFREIRLSRVEDIIGL